MARKKRGDDGGGYSWMDTYGDMVTLLLTFFVMLFASSSVDAEKFAILVRAFADAPVSAETAQLAPPGEGDQPAPQQGTGELPGKEIDIEDPQPIDINELYEYLKAYVESNNMQASVQIEKQSDNSVYLRFDNNIFFDADSSVLRVSSYDILDFMGDCFKSVEDQILVVRVNGHTASTSDPNYHVNDWELSSMRASAVTSFLEGQKSIDAEKLLANGYGKNHPIDSNDTVEGRAKNRRVDIMVLGNDFDKNNASEVYSILEKMMDVDMFDDKANASNIVMPDPPVSSDAGASVPESAAASTADDNVVSQAEDIVREAQEDLPALPAEGTASAP